MDSGDILELTGLKHEVEDAAKQMGYIDRPTNQTDMIFVGLGILLGGLFGALAIHLGGVPISLSTSGGALIADFCSVGYAASILLSEVSPNPLYGY